MMTDMNREKLIGAVQSAIEAEQQAADFYQVAADNTRDSKGKMMFQELVRFEKSHGAALKDLLLSIQSGSTFSAPYQGTSFAMPASEAPSGPIPTEELKTHIDALNTAIAAEKKARETYARLASEAEDPLLVALFSKLSDEENLHRKVLEDQFFALSNQGHWTWGE